MTNTKKRFIGAKSALIACLFAVIIIFPAGAADIQVPVLELITRGYLDNGTFTLGTRGEFDLVIAGGYKFGGQIVLDFESDDLEAIDGTGGTDQDLPSFKSANITMRNPLGLPLDLAYFTGEMDTFGTGDLFPDYFGAKAIASRFRGYQYFPNPTQVRFNGIHTVSGTGLRLSSNFLTNWNTTALYIYQDKYLGSGHYSVDLWTSINTPRFKMETFLGASYPASTYGYYRGGVLLYYDTGQGGEFLTQIGIPRWDPVNDPLQLDLFYLLFEPRVRFGLFSIVLTLFWHPEYYLQSETNELGTADINAKFQFGQPDESAANGGLEAQFGMGTVGDEQIKVAVAPFFSVVTSGVIWDLKVNVKLFPFDLTDMAEIFVGVRAEY